MRTQDKNRPFEVELRLLFPVEARRLIDEHLVLQEPRATPPQQQHLVTTYYDPPDLALAEAALTLRVRQSGERMTQTLKSGSDGSGAATRRGEWEWPVETDRPEFELLLQTPAGERLDPGLAWKLEPVFVTDVHRTIRILHLEDGATVEVAVDEGSIRAGDAEEALRELELELKLKAGPIGPLYQLALDLHSQLPLQIGSEPKAARGYRLRAGQAPSVVKVSDPELDCRVSAAEGFRQIVGTALADLLANQPAAAFGDAEGVHQMRVAIRRLRAVLVLFEPHLEPEVAGQFEDELRRFGQVLGGARDWDVFCLETLPMALAAASEESRRKALGDAAHAERRAAHDRLRDEFASSALTGLVLGMTVWIEKQLELSGSKAMQGPLSDIGPELLDRLARKASKRGRHIGRRSDEELHSFRKSLKKLRYGADYLSPLYPSKAVKPYLKRCKALQELLGRNNDAAMAAVLAGSLSRDDSVEIAFAIDGLAKLAAKRRGKALHRLPKAWHDFEEASPFWR